MKREFEEQYHQLEHQHWWHVGRRHLVRELVRRANADRGCRVLEIGCSGGILMRQLRDDGYTRVTGIDISAEAIAQCARNGVADAHEMDAQQPDFLPESFDVIAASDVLEHIADASGSLCVRIENRLICAGVHWPWSVSAMVIARNAAA